MTRTLLTTLATFSAVALWLTAGAAGQQPAAPSTPPPQPAPVDPANAPPTPPSNYQYAIEGRRDPFVALITRQGQQRGTTDVVSRGEGLAGITVDELVVRGILESRGAWVAMVTGPTGKVFTARAGDKLADGVIQTITPQALVLQQQLNDPLSIEKQREVRKYLRGGENK